MRRLAPRFIALGEPDYPLSLETIDGATPPLAVHGSLAALPKPMVAIVGGRNASARGHSFAARLARDLATAGFILVSGLARGIDRAVHAATAGSSTIGVMGGGFAKSYPPQHQPLVLDLIGAGCVVSECRSSGLPPPATSRATIGSSQACRSVSSSSRPRSNPHP
jgi:DNA processing protein